MLRNARLNFTTDVQPLQKEVLELSTQWLPHFQSRHYTGEWDVIALRSPGGMSDSPYAELRDGKVFRDTGLMEHCPGIKRTLELFQCEKQAVRLLNLKKGAVVKEHRDADLCYEKGEVRLHIPVFTNEAVEFYVDNKLMKMQEGECWYVNVNLPHRLSNHGDSDRIHLVIDCTVNDWIKTLFNDPANELNILSEAELWIRNKDERLEIISSLRMQNTATSIQMADEMERKLTRFVKDLET